MRKLVKTFKAVADPNRVRILKMLEIRSLCVCEIREVLNLANSTVSKHLSILRDAELILDEKEGKWVNYHLNDSASELYAEPILSLINEWLADDETILQDNEKVKSVDRKTLCAG